MIKSYTFLHSVSFTEHNFQSKLGDVCKHDFDKEQMVVYRDGDIVANFKLKNMGLETLENKGWIKDNSVVEAKPEPVAPKIEVNNEPETTNESEVKNETETTETKDEEVVDEAETTTPEDEETSEAGDDASDEEPVSDPASTPEAPVKKKGGRPRKNN